MTATAWTVYDSFMLEKNDGTQDLDDDTFYVTLFTSTYSPSTSGDTTYAGLSNEVAEANGYLTGGVSVAPSLDQAPGITTFGTANASWLAAGGNIVCMYAVIYNSTTGGLVAYTQLDPSDVTIYDTYSIILDIVASDVFTENRV